MRGQKSPQANPEGVIILRTLTEPEHVLVHKVDSFGPNPGKVSLTWYGIYIVYYNSGRGATRGKRVLKPQLSGNSIFSYRLKQTCSKIWDRRTFSPSWFSRAILCVTECRGIRPQAICQPGSG
jgi:hypothetical protein